MGTTGGDRNDKSRELFLVEGARSYLQAVTALKEFQREVQKQCRAVMEHNLESYTDALKVKLTTDEIRDYAWPDFGDWGDTWILGAQIMLWQIASLRWWETTCGLQYESQSGDNNKLYCWVGACFNTRNIASHVAEKLQERSRNAKVWQNGREVWIEEVINERDVANLKPVLQTLFKKWINLWKKAGGLKAAIK